VQLLKFKIKENARVRVLVIIADQVELGVNVSIGILT
jgi:hypothetical protein